MLYLIISSLVLCPASNRAVANAILAFQLSINKRGIFAYLPPPWWRTIGACPRTWPPSWTHVCLIPHIEAWISWESVHLAAFQVVSACAGVHCETHPKGWLEPNTICPSASLFDRAISSSVDKSASQPSLETRIGGAVAPILKPFLV